MFDMPHRAPRQSRRPLSVARKPCPAKVARSRAAKFIEEDVSGALERPRSRERTLREYHRLPAVKSAVSAPPSF